MSYNRGPGIRMFAGYLAGLVKALGAALVVMWVSVIVPGCAVKQTTHVSTPQPVGPPQEAPAGDLLARLDSLNKSIRTLSATVDFEPTTGSVYSGVIKEYRDVKGFILVEKPAMIRLIGQAPVVRTTLFDMVSDGETFRLYLPTRQKFYVGNNALLRPAKNALESMRPQHILDALLIPPPGSGEPYVYEEAEEGGRRYYVVTFLDGPKDREWTPRRKVWFDRANLEIARLELYGPRGVYLEDVHYSEFTSFEGIRYPTRVQLIRPVEDYGLTITFQKAIFNQSLGLEKFDLKKPASVQLVDLSAESRPEGPRGQ